jgi:hypothetical protein
VKAITCPLCSAKFDYAVALSFHIKAEHPGAVEASRELLARLSREERLEAKSSREIDAIRKVDSLYRDGCPCGHDLAWHREQRASVESGRVA